MTGNSSAPGARVGFVLKGYPRLSETFIAQEILALEQRGLAIDIISLRHPTDRARHPVHGQIQAPVLYLPEYLKDAPRRVIAGWRHARRLPRYAAARRAWLADLLRDPTPNRIRRFGQALVLAAEAAPEIGHLHAHFLHTPASVARYAALMRGLPWSVSAHAKDIWTIPEWEKRGKLASAEWAVTCTEAGRHHLAGLAPAQEKVALSYHGLDLDRFASPPARPATNDGSDPARPVALLSVGRAVEKKGYNDLLAALALLPPELSWRLVHIGGGALAKRLQREARRLGLDGRVEWRGAQPQPAVLAAYREADLFVLAAKIGKDADRDGLPNVLMEAQSQRLACVATGLPGIAELVLDGRTGVLAPPGDPPALAAALAGLIREPGRRDALGAAGEERVRRQFDMRRGIEKLVELFGLAPSEHATETGSASEDFPSPALRERGSKGCAQGMRVAFYAPLKPPDHPVPSGDRRVAQLFLDVLRLAGHEPFVASRLRSFDGNGDPERQARLAALGRGAAERLVRQWRRTPPAAPQLWFTYHLYYKAPDWLGPAVSRALGIPYVVAEASHAAKRQGGAWDLGHRAVAEALGGADAVLGLNPADRAGVLPLLRDTGRWIALPPFLDARLFQPQLPRPSGPVRLIAVAMMRPGDKLASYRVLGAALAMLPDLDWSLAVVGDGPAREEVAAALAPLGSRVVYRGMLGDNETAAALREADVFVWPAINEAFGMALLEAQASGLPVVAGASGGVPAIVAAGETGLLVPPGDAAAFAAALRRLIVSNDRRARMAASARAKVEREHDLPAAAARLGEAIRRLGRVRAA